MQVKEEAVANKIELELTNDQSEKTSQKQFNNFNHIKEKVDKILAESIPKMPPAAQSETVKLVQKDDKPIIEPTAGGSTLTEE